MNYSSMSTNKQRLDIAAFGFAKTIRPDCYDMRAAIGMEDIALDAYLPADPAKSVLGFAVFIRAAKMACLTPRHILLWLSRTWGGKQAIREYAKANLGMIQASAGRKAG